MNSDQQIFIVDDDASVRESLAILLQAAGFAVQAFASGRAFLEEHFNRSGCLIADINMPGMSGLDLQEEVARTGCHLPVIILTGNADVPLAVRAMKTGAIDFIEKPFDGPALVGSVERALTVGRQMRDRAEEAAAARKLLAGLTARERDVLDHLVKGRPNKVVAFELGISPRTVEIHRAHIMTKMKARSLSDLVRIALAAEDKNKALLSRQPAVPAAAPLN